MRATSMIRAISGFHQDNTGDWVAELSCLHGQHMRHRPPFQDRAWVTDTPTREARIGSSIDCPLCDRAEMPDGLAHLRTAGPWDELTLPKALQHSHRTGKAAWAIVKVTAGEVRFHMETSPLLEARLTAGTQQVIPPEVPHEVMLVGPMRLVVEFWGQPK
jgi:tellurite resistance-related uncharacterized protein